MKTIRISVNGKPYVVDVGDLAATPLSVVVNGKTYSVEVEKEPAAVRPGVAEAALAPSAPILQNDGNGHVAAAVPARVVPGSGQVTAPMPGKILSVKVAVGDRVAFGAELVVLEAMKMENMIRAQVAGVVKEVKVGPGQAVSFGNVLVVIE